MRTQNFSNSCLLETFQAGLSWITILNKRENFRKAFDNFDYKKIANYSEDKIQELLQDPGIIRNKLKVYSAVSNAMAFMKIQDEFGSFSKYIWGFVDGKPIDKQPKMSKRSTSHNSPFRYYQQRFKKTRIQVCRLHRSLRPHAGHRNGQRPRRRLLEKKLTHNYRFNPPKHKLHL